MDSWEDLPQLLDRLVLMADDVINQLQVIIVKGFAIPLLPVYTRKINVRTTDMFAL